MTRFRPCIDLHCGQVKQIVGGTLNESSSDLKTNYVSLQSSSYFAKRYKNNQLTGGHVIMLGPGNEDAAREALSTWPGGLQVGGGINENNAKQWIEDGAEKVVCMFVYNGRFLKLMPTGRSLLHLICSQKRNTRNHDSTLSWEHLMVTDQSSLSISAAASRAISGWWQ